jgi:hypothetical protein
MYNCLMAVDTVFDWLDNLTAMYTIASWWEDCTKPWHHGWIIEEV